MRPHDRLGSKLRMAAVSGVLLAGACGSAEGPDATPVRSSATGAGGSGSLVAGGAAPFRGAAGGSLTGGAGAQPTVVAPMPTAPVAGSRGPAAPQPTAGAPAPMPAAAGSGTAAAGSGAPVPPQSLAECPAPPAGASGPAVAALNAVNKLRLAAGAGCATLDLQISQAATAHCTYFQMNNTANPMCTANAHMEVMGCAGFTGASPIERMRAAGFMANGGGEVMAFLNNPERAVQTWVDSVWHRIPILDPTTSVLGYGATANPGACDTIDFGPGNRTGTNTVIVYPYDGQTNVTTTFDGSREGPMPPAPPTGWPSANPITLYAPTPMITEHVLTVDGTSEPIEHVWLDSNASQLSASDKQFLRRSVFMYANKPYMPNTKYRVKLSGTFAGGTIAKEWTFTTGAAPTGPRR